MHIINYMHVTNAKPMEIVKAAGAARVADVQVGKSERPRLGELRVAAHTLMLFGQTMGLRISSSLHA